MLSKDLLEFAAVNYDFNPDTLRHIARNSGKTQNQVYLFNKDGKDYIIKFEPPCDVYNNQVAETRALMDFSYYLAENNISVAKPLKAINGELVILDKDYIITAFEKLNGETWAFDPRNDKLSFNWGKVMGGMHRVLKDYKPPNKYDAQKDIFECYHWGSFFDRLKIYPEVYKISQELMSEIMLLPREKDSFGIIHADMHQGNIFIDGDKVSVFDFGDSMYGWFALDIAVSLCHALWWGRKDDEGNDYTSLIIENFIKGYLSANKLSAFWLSKIILFMKYRHLCMEPERNGIGCNHDEWVCNIRNDILFEGVDLKYIADIAERAGR